MNKFHLILRIKVIWLYLQLKLVAPNLDQWDSWQWILDDSCESNQMVHAMLLYSSIESNHSVRGMSMVNPTVIPIWMENYECLAIKRMVLDLDLQVTAFESQYNSLCRTFVLVVPILNEQLLRRLPTNITIPGNVYINYKYYRNTIHGNAIQSRVCHLAIPIIHDPIKIGPEKITTMNYQIWLKILTVFAAFQIDGWIKFGPNVEKKNLNEQKSTNSVR